MGNICKDCGGVDTRPLIEHVETIENGKKIITPILKNCAAVFIRPDSKLCLCHPLLSFKHIHKEE